MSPTAQVSDGAWPLPSSLRGWGVQELSEDTPGRIPAQNELGEGDLPAQQPLPFRTQHPARAWSLPAPCMGEVAPWYPAMCASGGGVSLCRRACPVQSPLRFPAVGSWELELSRASPSEVSSKGC